MCFYMAKKKAVETSVSLKKSHVMDKKTTHDTKIVVECQQDERIQGVEESIHSVNKRIEIMQMGFGKMVEEVCDKVDVLGDKFDDVMFPTKTHPNNGMINKVHSLRQELDTVQKTLEIINLRELKETVKELKDTVKTFKIWFTAGVFFISAVFSFVQWLVK